MKGYRKRTLVGVALLLGAAAARSANKAPSVPAVVAASTASVAAASSSTVKLPIVLESVENRAFGVGEKLRFAIKYEFITAGTATLEVHAGEPLNGRETIEYRSRAESNSFVDNFFKVRDFNSSGVDRKSLVSLRFHQNLREGGYRIMRTTYFDYDKGTYRFERIRKGRTTETSGPIAVPLQDMLSSFFFARTLPLELGKQYSVTAFSDEEVYPLVITVHPKLHKIKVPAGEFECIRIEPKVQGDAIFQSSDGKMQIWLTNDERRMPVLIRSKVAVGAFDAELETFETAKPTE